MLLLLFTGLDGKYVPLLRWQQSKKVVSCASIIRDCAKLGMSAGWNDSCANNELPFGVNYKNINNYYVTCARSCNNNKKSFVLIPYFFLLWISTTFNFIAPFTATLLLALFIINSNKRLLPPPVTIITITPPRCPLIHLHQRKWITPQQRIEQSVVVSIKEGIEDKKPLE